MAIFTKQFSDADDYEDWLKHANGRINVLSIANSPTVFGTTLHRPGGPVVVKYQTHDKSFAPPRVATGKVMEYAIVGAAFFALFAYVITEL
ncbi:MAG: hypothetical protein WCA22_02270 [Candidatus Binatus sp.]